MCSLSDFLPHTLHSPRVRTAAWHRSCPTWRKVPSAPPGMSLAPSSFPDAPFYSLALLSNACMVSALHGPLCPLLVRAAPSPLSTRHVLPLFTCFTVNPSSFFIRLNSHSFPPHGSIHTGAVHPVRDSGLRALTSCRNPPILSHQLSTTHRAGQPV
jgi:hypothetical protein